MNVIVMSSEELKDLISDNVEAAFARWMNRMGQGSHSTPKEWFTNQEAMHFLGLSKATLQRYRDSGALPHSKVGANIYYRYVDVVALLERNRRG